VFGLGCFIRLAYKIDIKMLLSLTIVVLPSKMNKTAPAIPVTIALLSVAVRDSTISMLLGAG